MRIVYSPRYAVDIGPHVFPTLKYRMVHARLLETGVIHPADVIEPSPASWDELALVHTTEYLTKMRNGTLSPEDIAQLELPWSQGQVEGQIHRLKLIKRAGYGRASFALLRQRVVAAA